MGAPCPSPRPHFLRLFHMAVPQLHPSFFRFIYYHYYFLNFWLRRVLVAARGLFLVVRRLLSSCGVRVFSSLVVARGLRSAWAL